MLVDVSYRDGGDDPMGEVPSQAEILRLSQVSQNSRTLHICQNISHWAMPSVNLIFLQIHKTQCNAWINLIVYCKCIARHKKINFSYL